MKYIGFVSINNDVIEELCLDDVLTISKMSLIRIGSYIRFKDTKYCVESILIDLDNNEVCLKLRKI